MKTRDILAWGILLCAPNFAFAAVTAQVSTDGTTTTLSVTGDGDADQIIITCDAGNVKITGLDPVTGAAACSSINSITIAAGENNDTIDLKGVLRSGFTATPAISIDAGGGDDIVYGSVFNEVIIGGFGNDQLHGGLGDDDLSPQEGNDIVHGNEGNDTLRTFFDGSRDHLDGDSGSDTLIVEGTPSADDINIYDDPTLPETSHNHIDVRGAAIWARVGLVEQIIFNLGDGDDTVTATLFPAEKLELHGGGGNDTLTFSGQCSTGMLTATSYAQQSLQAATFDGFESSTVSNELVVGTVAIDVGPQEGSVDVAVTTGAQCAWTATTNDTWLTLPQSNGTGSFTLKVGVAANTSSAPRVGTINVASLAVTITQAGSDGSNTTGGGVAASGAVSADGSVKKKGCAATYESASLLLGAFYLLRRRRQSLSNL